MSCSLLNLLAPWVSVQAPPARGIPTFPLLFQTRHTSWHPRDSMIFTIQFLCNYMPSANLAQSRCLGHFWENFLPGSSTLNTFSLISKRRERGKSFSFIVIVSVSRFPHSGFITVGEINSNLDYEKELVNVVNISRSFVSILKSHHKKGWKICLNSSLVFNMYKKVHLFLEYYEGLRLGYIITQFLIRIYLEKYNW